MSRERGFFMVWMALTLVTLTAFAGLGLEFSRWNQISARAQKAADAAALAGAVYLPDQPANAFVAAKSVAKKNGFDDLASDVVVTAVQGALDNQLKVTVKIETKNPWGQLVNYNSTTIVRSAVAEYQLPQNLGSPENTYGNDPVAGVNPQFWGDVNGPGSEKINGDAIQANLCSGGTDNCSGSNADYETTGYYYGIDVPEGAVGALDVQVWDPAFVHTGPTCTDNGGREVTNLDAAAALAPNFNASFPVSNPSVRYASGNGPYCNGDQYYGSVNTWTTWRVLAPDTSSWDPSNNPAVAGCAKEYPGIYPTTTNDQPTGGSASNTRLASLLQGTAAYPNTSPPAVFASFFRQWVSICNIGVPTTGTYFLQVQTRTKLNGTTAPNGSGANTFSIRAGIGGSFALNNGLHVYGNRRMGIYANAVGATTQFYLTRVPPSEAGRTLILQFFDTGDSPNNDAATLTVLPPADASLTSTMTPLTAFANCKYTRPPGNSTGPPWGTLIATGAGCAISPVTRDGTGGNPGYNGQWVTFSVPIPTDYTCTGATATGCWVQIRFDFTATGASVNDKTTWEAYIQGDPVRLIE